MKNVIIFLKDLMKITGLSRSTIYLRLNEEDGDFPKPINLGGRRVGWIEAEVDEWIERQMERR